jgi:hypothetical protein
VLNRTPRREYESEENNTLYVFWHTKYCNSLAEKLSDWVYCQEKTEKLNHKICVGKKGKKFFYIRTLCQHKMKQDI